MHETGTVALWSAQGLWSGVRVGVTAVAWRPPVAGARGARMAGAGDIQARVFRVQRREKIRTNNFFGRKLN